MALGDQSDFATRLRAVLPLGWFPAPPASGGTTQTPVLDALLLGLGNAWAYLYSLLAYTRAQTRLATMNGAFVDMFSADMFGGTLPRNSGETDAAFKVRILADFTAPKNTRAAVSAAIASATGNTPNIIEPLNASDTKGYGSTSTPATGGGYGYGTTGLRYGSLSTPGVFFVEMPLGSSLTATANAVLGAKADGIGVGIRIKTS